MVRPRFEISIVNRESQTRLSKAKLLGWTRKLLRQFNRKRIGLSLVLVNDSEIRRLHRQFLGKDQATDVLAFGAGEGKPFPLIKGGTPFLGEVVVSVETAKRRAPEFGNRWEEELLLYVSHGMLHLMGWRDATPREREKMHRREKEILRKVLGPQWRSRRRKPLF